MRKTLNIRDIKYSGLTLEWALTGLIKVTEPGKTDDNEMTEESMKSVHGMTAQKMKHGEQSDRKQATERKQHAGNSTFNCSEEKGNSQQQPSA